MAKRIDYYKVAPGGLEHILNMEKYLSTNTTLEPLLIELVKIRVSQLNHCAYCINAHTVDARKLGETEQRIYLLNAWKETTLYSEREKMALKFAESVTLIADNPISETLYQQARQFFDEKEYTDLVLLIAQMNTWNRLGISMGLSVN